MSYKGTSERRVSGIFQSLEGHSVLHLLHHCTNLSELDYSDVLNILRKNPPRILPGI